MEWLQTYKIGKALLDSKKYEPIDAYFQNYKVQRTKEPPFPLKKSYVLDLLIDTTKSSVDISFREFDESEIREDNFLSSISGNFTSYYLATSYKNKENILDFFGIREGKLIVPKKAEDENIGYEKEYQELIKKKLLSSNFPETNLIKKRQKVRENDLIVRKLDSIVINLKNIVEKNNKKTSIYDFFLLDLFSDEEIKAIKNFNKFSLGEKGNEEIAYVCVKVDGLFLNKLPEYRDFCFKRFISLGKIEEKAKINSNCYFNGENISYAVELPRDNVNILKSSVDSFSSSSYFRGNSFLVSENAYNALKLGAKYIDQYLKIKISGISHYIIPEFNGEISIDKLKSQVKNNFELAFSLKEYDDTKRDFYRLAKQNINAISLVGHVKGKGDIDFINTIRIANPSHFDEIFALLEKCKTDVNYNGRGFSLQSIHYLFPVSSEKTKKPPSLLFYKSLFERTLIEKGFILENYRKILEIYRFGKPDKNEKLYLGSVNIRYNNSLSFDSEIIAITKKFQILFNLITQTYHSYIYMKDYNIFPKKTKHFFEASAYSEPQIALFHLGKMLRRVANAQSKKQKNGRKPILDKLNYSGMKVNDIKWLMCEIFEKFNQYEIKFYEEDLRFFKEYFDKSESHWNLEDMENVFYLFSGYAMFWEVIEPKEKKILEKEGIQTPELPSESEPTDESNNDENEEEN